MLKVTFNEWKNHIDYKKSVIIQKYNESTKSNVSNASNASRPTYNCLDNSKENKEFNNIFDSIIKTNSFDLSYISFKAIELLSSVFIDTHIIRNALDIKQTEKEIEKKQEQEQTQTQTQEQEIGSESCNKNTLINKQEQDLQNIIKLIIELTVNIEIMLNIHYMLIKIFINKHTISNETRDDKHETINIDKLVIIDTINNSNILPSTLILLFLKLINKLGCMHLANEIIIFEQLQINNNNNNTSNIKKQNIEISLQMKCLLDTFILKIAKYFDNVNNNVNNINIINNNIYSICSSYIVSIFDLFLYKFDNIFDILETYIIKSKPNITEPDLIKLKDIRNQIKSLLEIEFTNMKVKVF